MGTDGSVSYLFERKGVIEVKPGPSEDQVMEAALEAGAEDFKAEPEGYEILTDPAHFEAVHRAVEAKGIKCASAEVTFLPLLTVPLAGGEAGSVQKLLDQLDDHEDVKELYHNAELPEA